MTDQAITCVTFDDDVEELALGLIAEPYRSDLVAHAARCPRCQSALDSLVPVIDRLLLLAPEVEPAAGFENRALARLGITPANAGARRSPRRWITVAAAAVIALGVGIAGTRLVDDHRGSSDRAGARPASSTAPGGSTPLGVTVTGTIVTSTGAPLGTVQLASTPTPHVLLSVARPRGGSGVRTCELQRRDGTWVPVGSWDVTQIASGVWATGIDASLLDAVAMRITLEDATVVATASLA